MISKVILGILLFAFFVQLNSLPVDINRVCQLEVEGDNSTSASQCRRYTECCEHVCHNRGGHHYSRCAYKGGFNKQTTYCDCIIKNAFVKFLLADHAATFNATLLLIKEKAQLNDTNWP